MRAEDGDWEVTGLCICKRDAFSKLGRLHTPEHARKQRWLPGKVQCNRVILKGIQKYQFVPTVGLGHEWKILVNNVEHEVGISRI